MLIHTKQCLVNHFHLSEYAHQIQIQHCMFHSLPNILGYLSIDTWGGKNNVYFFLHQHYARSCTWYVSVKNCLADAFFGRSTHTLDLPSLVKKKHLGYWNTLQYVPSGRGGVISREYFILGSSHFWQIVLCASMSRFIHWAQWR